MRTTGTYRWLICALLFFATTINYIDRQILSLLKPILDEELHWTNEQFGLVNAAFQGAYAAGLLFFGWFVDRFGTRVGYAVSITAWSLAAMAHATVNTIGGFLGARVSLGLGEGGNFPSAVKAVTEWFPKKERAFATSLFNSGANVGAILAPATIPWIALTWGWHAAFLIAGILGFVWLGAWLALYEIPERLGRLRPSELAYIRSDAGAPETEAGVPWRSLLGYRQTWSFIAAKFLTDPIWWFFLIWLPDFFKQTRGMDLKQMGLPLVAIYSIVTVLSIAGGYFTGFLIGRGWPASRARKTGMLLFAVCVIPILGVTQAPLWGAVALIGLAGAAHQAWSATLYTTVSDMFPKGAVASVIGIGSMAGSVGGMLFPLFTGKLLDHFAALGSPGEGYKVLFGVGAFAYVAAFALNSLLAPRFERIKVRGTAY